MDSKAAGIATVCERVQRPSAAAAEPQMAVTIGERPGKRDGRAQAPLLMNSFSESEDPRRPAIASSDASVWWALAIALALRLATIAYFAPPPSWDGTIYTALARSLASGQGYVHWDGSGRATAFFPVGYPAVLSVALRFVRSDALAVWSVNLLAGAAGCALTAWIVGRIADVRAARTAAWMYALYPSLVLFSAAAMTETLQSTLLLAVMAVVVASKDGPRTDQAGTSLARNPALASVAAGIVLAAACFVRPQTIVLAPIVGGLCGRSRSSRVICALLSTATVLALAAPWAARNARELDAPTLYSTNGGSNLLIGTLPSARGGYRALTASDPCGLVRGEVRRDRCMTRAAVDRIANDPLGWVALAPRKALKTVGYEWSAVSYLRSASVNKPPRWVTALLAALCTTGWWALVARAIATSWRARRARDPREATRSARWFALAAAASVLLVHVAFIADDRYHLVVVPVMIAAWGAGSSPSDRALAP